MRELRVKERKPRKIKRIDDRIKDIKNPYLTNEYLWEFNTQYIKIRADLSDSGDTWFVNIYPSEKRLKEDKPSNTFEEKTLDCAISCANRYADRCNLTKEEYVTPA